MWWYTGGDTVIRVELGDTQLEGVTGSGQQREASAFLEQLTEVKGKKNLTARQAQGKATLNRLT